MTLYEMRPAILKIHRVAEGSITRRFYPEHPSGRHSDGFVYILQGSMIYRFSNGMAFEAKEGDVLFLSQGSRYSMELVSDVYKYIFIDFNFLKDNGEPVLSELFSMQNTKNVESMFKRMLEKWRLQKPAVNEETMAILYSIYAEAIRAQNCAYVPIAKRNRIDTAVQFISDNFSDDSLTVESVAESAGMSESHFRRLFKDLYNLSPVKYINLIRINRAKELIRYSNASFSNIAIETGFANLYYFSRMFKREVGCTPSEYREAYSDSQGI